MFNNNATGADKVDITMSMQPIQPSINDTFTSLVLGHPIMMNGTFFSDIFIDGTRRPVIVQTPTVMLKNGIVQSSAKKWYADIMVPHSESIFIQWIEKLELQCKADILQNSSAWFETPLDENDIETAFTPAFKIYKSGKYYVMRVAVNVAVRISSDDSVNTILHPDAIVAQQTPVIALLEIRGIRFSAHSFHIEMDLKQIMIVRIDPYTDQNLLRLRNSEPAHVPAPVHNTATVSTTSNPNTFIENPDLEPIESDVEYDEPDLEPDEPDLEPDSMDDMDRFDSTIGHSGVNDIDIGAINVEDDNVMVLGDPVEILKRQSSAPIAPIAPIVQQHAFGNSGDEDIRTTCNQIYDMIGQLLERQKRDQEEVLQLQRQLIELSSRMGGGKGGNRQPTRRT